MGWLRQMWRNIYTHTHPSKDTWFLFRIKPCYVRHPVGNSARLCVFFWAAYFGTFVGQPKLWHRNFEETWQQAFHLLNCHGFCQGKERHQFPEVTATCRPSSRAEATLVMRALTVVPRSACPRDAQATAQPRRGPPDQGVAPLRGLLGGLRENGADVRPKCPLMKTLHIMSVVFNISSLFWINQKSFSAQK